MSVYTKPVHQWDEDGCCVHCNFDGAEWHHWKHNTYEGRASTETMPPCVQRTNSERAEEALINAITEYDEIDDEQLDDDAVQEGRW